MAEVTSGRMTVICLDSDEADALESTLGGVGEDELGVLLDLFHALEVR